jgi:hypothetical protein
VTVDQGHKSGFELVILSSTRMKSEFYLLYFYAFSILLHCDTIIPAHLPYSNKYESVYDSWSRYPLTVVSWPQLSLQFSLGCRDECFATFKTL